MTTESIRISREAARSPSALQLKNLHRLSEVRAMEFSLDRADSLPSSQSNGSEQPNESLPSRVRTATTTLGIWGICSLMLARLPAVLGVLFVMALLLTQAAQADTVFVFVDCSGSMQGKKATAAKEGTKLMLAMAEESTEFVIVPFNESAVVGRFTMSRDRESAIRWVNSFQVAAGTNYVAAIEAADLPANAQGLFISDGEHNTGGPTSAVFDALKRHAKGRLHTISVDCPAGSAAEGLLTQMAALTGGGYTRVEDDSETLVRKMVELVVRAGQYRSYRPRQETIHFKATTGRILAFGYDGVPNIQGDGTLPGPLYRHHAELPDQKVDLAAVDLAQPTDITVRLTDKHGTRARLGDIHRNDLPRARTNLTTNNGRVAAGDRLKTTIRFTDRQGAPVPSSQNLSAEVQLLDPGQKVLGHAVARPTANQGEYQAQLQIPDQSGPLTIRSETSVKTDEGHGFTASDDQTVLVQKAYVLAVTPTPLHISGKIGSFQAQLTVEINGAAGIPATFTAQLADDIPGFRLVNTHSDKAILTLDFQADRPGTYRGELVVSAAGEVLTKSVEVPFSFELQPPFRGLALPRTRELDLGTRLASSGPVEMPLRIPSLDDAPATYEVEANDLAGPSATIAVRCNQSTIRPSKANPAELKLSLNVENLPAGTYKGSLCARPSGAVGQNTWETKLRLTITEPLSARPLDIGKIEAGKILTVPWHLTNLGTAGLGTISVVMPAKFKGTVGETLDVVLTVPNDLGILGPGQDKQIDARVAVSPLMKARGTFAAELRVQRGGIDAIQVPVTLEVVPEGEGPSAIQAAPEKLDLKAAPGEIAQAVVRIKLAAPANADTVEAAATPFNDSTGAKVPLTAAFQWPDGQKLAAHAPLTFKGFFVAPKTKGTFRGSVTIRCQHEGAKNVPVSLTVQ